MPVGKYYKKEICSEPNKTQFASSPEVVDLKNKTVSNLQPLQPEKDSNLRMTWDKDQAEGLVVKSWQKSKRPNLEHLQENLASG